MARFGACRISLGARCALMVQVAGVGVYRHRLLFVKSWHAFCFCIFAIESLGRRRVVSRTLDLSMGIQQMNTKSLFLSMLAAPLMIASSAPVTAAGTDLGHGLNLSGTVTVVNDYRFRGYSQTNFKPAAQVGLELTHESGFYIGNWNSNVGWTTGTSLEMDFYGGWRGEVSGIGLDAGVLQYSYPGADMAVSPNTTELYVGVSKGPVSLKVSYSPTNWFGYENSKNSWYFDGAGKFDLGDGWGVGVHAGYQVLQNVMDANGNSVSGYFDYKAGISKDISGWVFDLSVVGASTDSLFLTSQGYNAGRVGLLFSIAKGF